MKALNSTTGKELAAKLTVADTAFSRAKGLLGKKGLPRGEGLLIKPCKGVHSFFMRFAIDVVFLDKRNYIVETVADLKPQRMTKVLLSSSSAIELPAGTIKASGTAVGNLIVFY